MDKVLVTRSVLPDFDEYCEEIKKIWDSHWMTNMGIEHHNLQSALEEYLNCPHVTLFTNGHLALENIISAMNFPKGKEIITTPFTFVSTTHAIVRSGCIPVFCDINADDYTIDADKIENLITENTVAIVPVHVYGNVCNVEKIKKIAEKYKLKVIYDAAHAFGVQYKGISSANFGDASIFSFHATKIFNTIEGGAVCYKDEKFVQILDDLKNFGIRNEENVECIGGNAKMNEFQAAMGICNLRHIDEEIEMRKKICDHYYSRLSNINGIKLNNIQKDTVHNYSYFPIIFNNYKYRRDEVYKKLKNENIIARKYFYPLTNEFGCYKNVKSINYNETPIAKWVSERVLTLPLYSGLSFDIIDKICDIIIG